MAKDIELEASNKTKQYLTNLFRARFPFIYIATWEEIRIIQMIIDIANNSEVIKSTREVFCWSITEGLNKITNKGQEKVNINNQENPNEALNFISNYNKSAILILKDVHSFLGVSNRNADYSFIRKVRDTASSIKNDNYSKNVVIVSPTLVLPIELQKDVTVVDFDLPSLSELKNLLNEMIEANSGSSIKISLKENEKDILCKGAQGLTLQEAENAFARAMVTKGRLSLNELDIIMEEKCQVIKKTGILEYVNANINIDDVGGLENMKRWLRKRKNS